MKNISSTPQKVLTAPRNTRRMLLLRRFSIVVFALCLPVGLALASQALAERPGPPQLPQHARAGSCDLAAIGLNESSLNGSGPVRAVTG